MNNTLKRLAAVAMTSLVIGALQTVAAEASCQSYSTSRITCSNSSNGFTSYNSYNPRTGYQSFGTRQDYGSSSYSNGTARYGSGTTRSWSRWNSRW